jgi:phasin family protein
MAKAPELSTAPEAPAASPMPFDIPKMMGGIDPTKLMGGFDPTKMMADLTAMMQQFRLPGFDPAALMALQQKNVEAVVQANRVLFDGAQAMAKRQLEIFQEAMGQTAKAMEDLSKAGTPGDVVAKQAELAKNAFEKTVAAMRELAEIMNKSSTAATGAVNARFAQSLNEFKELAVKMN